MSTGGVDRIWLARSLGFIAAALIVAVGLYDPGPAVRAGQTTVFTRDQLIVSSRDGLSICVQLDGVSGAAVPSPAFAVRTALAPLSQHPLWNIAGYGKRELIVDRGCPATSVMMAPTIRRHGSSREEVPRRRVDPASLYRVWVNVLPDERIADVFLNAPPHLRLESEEIVCDSLYVPGQSMGRPPCMAASLGVSLTAAEFSDSATLTEALKFALNLGSLGILGGDPRAGLPHGVVLAGSREEAMRMSAGSPSPLPSPSP